MNEQRKWSNRDRNNVVLNTWSYEFDEALYCRYPLLDRLEEVRELLVCEEGVVCEGEGALNSTVRREVIPLQR